MSRLKALVLAASLLAATATYAERAAARNLIHVVAKGQTLGIIAGRYGTTVRALELANHLKPGAQLYPGQKLRVLNVRDDPPAPDDDTPAPGTAKRDASKSAGASGRQERAVGLARSSSPPSRDEQDDDDPEDAWACPSEGVRSTLAPSPSRVGNKSGAAAPFARKPARPGFVSLLRYGETFRGQLVDERRRVLPQARARTSHLMRDLRTRKEIPIDERLLQLLAEVSDHFGGRTIVVVSGYREYTPRQFTRYSRHNVGRAVDFRVVGVPNEVLRDFCMTLTGVGVGYYPNSTFVHLDNRGYRSAWVDYSQPGEPPIYTCPDKSGPTAGQAKPRPVPTQVTPSKRGAPTRSASDTATRAAAPRGGATGAARATGPGAAGPSGRSPRATPPR